MASIRILVLIAGVCALPMGCALTIPLVGHDFAQYSGETLKTKNSTHLIVNEALYPRYQIRAGKPKEGEREVCVLPEGTPIQFRSFWRADRMRVMGAPIRSDYALVMVDSPDMGQVAAELPMSELDGVFDGENQQIEAANEE